MHIQTQIMGNHWLAYV